MGTIASQITSLTIVYSTAYSDADQENIKAPRHRPFLGEFTGELPAQMASNAENVSIMDMQSYFTEKCGIWIHILVLISDKLCLQKWHLYVCNVLQNKSRYIPLIARFLGLSWSPLDGDRTQVDPMLASWTLLSGTSLFRCSWLQSECTSEIDVKEYNNLVYNTQINEYVTLFPLCVAFFVTMLNVDTQMLILEGALRINVFLTHLGPNIMTDIMQMTFAK